ncbi:formate dehydrogenase accessory sulfurtransferase FdhD [Dictyobacter arantiisoli]|uniref:Sulfur carrier protein FdhD n=1 Tax=Dictyobacter arantiisoli TaxID=2014874 RepID=A0A5A5TFH8_9CHLR|nr:formate dehydrogenase accessory sulfurtransferase FdhD [Dictyobacter arantiisoli]GCF09896.1 sulfurtransferase FdhD [Dictyobacter arantiisoli]
MTFSHSWRSALDPQRVMEAGVVHWQDEHALEAAEYLTMEEPFEIRLAHQSLAVIMRTPGHDEELALGFLLTEGIIHTGYDVLSVANDEDEDGLPLENVVTVMLRSVTQQSALQAHPTIFERHFAVSASCGLCGKNSIADILQAVPRLEPDTLQVPASIFYTLSDQLRAQQAVFRHTGGLHAAGLYNLQGELLLSREDIGRHNAVDKLIGNGLLQGFFPYREHILLVSGRTSFEIIQKALLARIPFVTAISAPSSMAVELADKGGITLIGFLRDHSMNVYTHPERISQE